MKTAIILASVLVTADKLGNAIVPSKENPEWGHVRVEHKRFIVEEGFGRTKTLSALIHAPIVELQAQGFHKGQELAGKIIFKESLTPFNKKNPEKDYKMAGTSGVVCKYNNQPIYRKTFYVQDVNTSDVPLMTEDGELLKHTNTEEIKAAYARQKANETASTQGLDA